MEDELRPECGGWQLWTRKGQQAQGCGQLRVGVTQILTLAEQGPSWSRGSFFRVAVLRQDGRSLLRGTWPALSGNTQYFQASGPPAIRVLSVPR